MVGAEAAGHDDHEHVEGQQEGEHFVDGGIVRLPSSACEERAEAEGEHLVLKVSMPMILAAISSSRMALKMLPVLLPKS